VRLFNQEASMGVKTGISMDAWPEQTDWVGRRVDVCFLDDASHRIAGEIVRDDISGNRPITIIKLDDGRYVLNTECQYSPPKRG
jgi:hypothetical protein